MFIKDNAKSNSVRNSSISTMLTANSDQAARDIIVELVANEEKFAAQVTESHTSNEAMDAILAQFEQKVSFDRAFMDEAPAEDLIKLLRSQQSKRSRSKNVEAMTQMNYTRLMSAAIAEHNLRIQLDMPKSNAGVRKANIEYSAEELEALKTDHDGLQRAIRNVQSKKSNERTSEGFDEANPTERWKQIMKAEEQLFEIRDKYSEQQKAAREEAKAQAAAILDANPSELKADEARELLKQAQAALLSL